MAEAPHRRGDAPRRHFRTKKCRRCSRKTPPTAVRPYDFTAQRINRMQLPLLEVISKSFADRAGASLSAMLGRDASMQFTSLESVKSADLQAALPVPAHSRGGAAQAAAGLCLRQRRAQPAA